MTAEVITLAPSAATKFGMSELLYRTKGGGARVLHHLKHYRTLPARALRRLLSFGPIAAVASKVSAVWNYALPRIKTPYARWVGLAALTQPGPRKALAKVASLALKPVGMVLGVALTAVRTPLSWVKLDGVFDRGVGYAVVGGMKAYGWVKTTVSPYFHTESRAMHTTNAVANVMILKQVPGLRFIAPVARFTKMIKVVLVALSVSEIITSLYAAYGEFIPASVRARITSLVPARFRKTEVEQVEVVAGGIDSAAKVAKITEELKGRAAKAATAETLNAARKAALDVEMKRLDDIGLVKYAELVRDKEVAYHPEVMGRNESKRILEEAGLPTRSVKAKAETKV